ncbi:MAG: outer membrane beta-barrel protein [Vicinamibacteria bacterium]
MRKAALFLVGALAVAGASQASAETILTPYAGAVFSGDTPKSHVVYGGSLAFTARTGLGFEVDFGLAPDFFDGDDFEVPNSNLTTLMGNIMFSGAVGGNSRIYGSAGGGLMKSSVDDADDFFDVSRNDFGVNAGAGIIVGVSDKVGIRGDIRYFRNIGDEEPDNEFDVDFGSFSYWRGTAGIAFTF